ncbi:MAG TPA: MarR family transcriptional regulator [Candidatus Dormibacteraeota bacterium]|nr:MarR family transcriptional regulator [Candidatus Dormibacteraeota bacterium]
MSTRRDLVELVGSRLRRATTAIDGLDQRATIFFGVNRTDLRLLDLLASRGPLSAGELGRAAGISSGGMTVALDRLTRAGYVLRTPNDNDRRSVMVQVTEKIEGPSQAAFGPLQARVEAILEGYRAEQLELLAEFLDSWADAIEDALRG